MKKTVLVYQSKYGFTEKYARWIAEALSCDLFAREDVKAKNLAVYDTIVYAGGLYAGGVSGVDLIVKNFDAIGGKNIVLVTCGLADATDEENISNIMASLKKKLTPRMEEQIKIFHLRGGIDYSRLSIVHKAMMAMLRKVLMKKDSNTLKDEEKQLLDTYGKAVDFTDKYSISPIVSYVQEL